MQNTTLILENDREKVISEMRVWVSELDAKANKIVSWGSVFIRELTNRLESDRWICIDIPETAKGIIKSDSEKHFPQEPEVLERIIWKLLKLGTSDVFIEGLPFKKTPKSKKEFRNCYRSGFWFIDHTESIVIGHLIEDVPVTCMLRPGTLLSEIINELKDDPRRVD